MLAASRKEQITKLITKRKHITVEELSKRFGVSGETVRRDLKELEKKGILKRTYGGAYLEGSRESDVSVQVRKSLLLKGKEDIASLCEQFIQADDTIFLDSSTTSLEIAKKIPHFPITVITYSLLIANYLSDFKNVRTIMLGGVLDTVNMCFTGKSTLTELSNYYATKGFISCRSLSGKYGAMDSNEQIGQVRSAAIKNCYSSYLVADHTKFSRTALYQIGNLEQFHAIVTDQKPDNYWLEELDRRGVTLYYPETSSITEQDD